MNILILTKSRYFMLKKSHRSVDDYIVEDPFFEGWKKGFEKQSCKVFINWNESFFLPTFLRLKIPFYLNTFLGKPYFIARVINFFLKKTKLYLLDRLLFTKKITSFCKKKKIDLIFTEINSFIVPNLIKKKYPQITITQWFGVFPEMCDQETLRINAQYDILWTASKYNPQKVFFQGMEKSFYLACGVNKDFFYYDYDEKFAHDIVFVGGIGKGHFNRIKILESLSKEFDNFVFYGYGVENLTAGSELKKKHLRQINPEEMKKVFSSSKITINLTLDNYDRLLKGFNVRLFEVSACSGALQIVVNDKKLEEFFTPNEDLVTFKNTNDLIDKIKYYLKNEKQRIKMVKSAFKKSKKYTFDEKAKKVIELVNQYKKGKLFKK